MCVPQRTFEGHRTPYGSQFSPAVQALGIKFRSSGLLDDKCLYLPSHLTSPLKIYLGGHVCMFTCVWMHVSMCMHPRGDGTSLRWCFLLPVSCPSCVLSQGLLL